MKTFTVPPLAREEAAPAPAIPAHWEMVVPRMVRPGKLSAALPEPIPEVQEVATPEPEIFDSPLVRDYAAAPTRSLAGVGWKLLFGAAFLSVLLALFFKQSSAPRAKNSTVDVETDKRGGGWIREMTIPADAGAKQSRQLVLYHPSLNATDGHVEFNWKVDMQGVGWIFRAKDTSNYYASKVKAISQAPFLTVSVEHFWVKFGHEGPHSEKVLVLPRRDSSLRIKMDVAGPAFTLYLQGNAVDYWNDTGLTAGAFGFYEEWHQTADVQSVRMSFTQGTRTQRERHRPDIGAVLAMNRWRLLSVLSAPASGGA